MRAVRKAVLFAWIALSVSWSPSARAEESEVERRFARAIELRKDGHDKEALAVLEELDHTSPTPRSRAQVALAEQALGKWVDAEVHLADALSRSDAWIQRNHAPLEAALQAIRRHLGSLDISGVEEAKSTSEVLLRVDGKGAGMLPLRTPLRLPVGQHRIEVQGDGFLPVARSVEIQAGQLAREYVELVRVSSAAPPPGTTTRESPGPVLAPPQNESASSAPQRQDHAGSHATLRTVGFVGLGGALVSGAVAVVSVLQSNAHATSYNDNAECSLPNKSQACQDERALVTTWRNVAIVSGIATGVLAASGVTLLVLGRDSSVKVSTSTNGVLVTGAL